MSESRSAHRRRQPRLCSGRLRVGAAAAGVGLRWRLRRLAGPAGGRGPVEAEEGGGRGGEGLDLHLRAGVRRERGRKEGKEGESDRETRTKGDREKEVESERS